MDAQGAVSDEGAIRLIGVAPIPHAGGDDVMASLYAYGPERNFAFPPRPANARAGWQPEWIARARFRSMTMAMLGINMAAMGGDETSGAQATQAEAQPPSKPKCRGGLAGIAQRAAGLCR